MLLPILQAFSMKKESSNDADRCGFFLNISTQLAINLVIAAAGLPHQEQQRPKHTEHQDSFNVQSKHKERLT